MLIFPLKKEWYEKIKSGEKEIEYREVKPYWTKRIATTLFAQMYSLFPSDFVFNKISAIGFKKKFAACYPANKCVLRLGYTKRRMNAYVSLIEVVNGKNTDLHIDKPVYAIHLSKVGEA